MSHTRITLLVVAHLGASGCASQSPIVEADVIPIGSVAPQSSSEAYVFGNEPGPLGSTLAPLPSNAPPEASAVASSRPPFRPQPRPIASVSPRPPPPPRPTVYRGNARVVPGRPLVAFGIAHVAPYTTEHAPVVASDDVDALLLAARDEHASIAAFARTIAELMALGAPLSLLHETQAALGDEIRHTSMTLELLERLTGERRILAPLEAATLPLARSRADFFRDVLRGGAVGETFAAADADARRERATEPELRAYYETIANDEARHAALAFKTLRWLLDLDPSLAAVLADERACLSLEERTLTGPLFTRIATS